MNKTGLKAFVYSFSVSLLTIFAVNKVYLHIPQEKNNEIKLPQKNVVLFLKSDAVHPSSYAAPTQKIALNVLPKNQKTDKEVTFEEPEIILAENFESYDIPIEISHTMPKIFEDVQNNEVQNPTTSYDVADISTVQVKEAKPLPSVAESQEEYQDKISIPLDIPALASSITPPITAKKQEPEIKLAVLPPKDKKNTTNNLEPQLLLPIEKTEPPMFLDDSEVFIGNTDNINQIALANKNVPISGMKKANKTNPEEKINEPKWKSMSEQEASPWTTAHARGLSKNQFVNDAKKEFETISDTISSSPSDTNGIQVASETIQNLIIPIPEKIVNKENLTPKLSFDSKNQNKPEEAEDIAAELPITESETKNKLLASIGSIFSGDKKTKTEETDGVISKAKKTLNKLKNKITPSDMGKIMPTEMRLSFQPGRAEISGQTLRWIRAFASRAATDNSIAIEIRIDGTSATSLQQKRLNLLYNILISKEVPLSKINTVFTQREQNSFIIKLTPTTNRKDTETKKITQGYYQYW